LVFDATNTNVSVEAANPDQQVQVRTLGPKCVEILNEKHAQKQSLAQGGIERKVDASGRRGDERGKGIVVWCGEDGGVVRSGNKIITCKDILFLELKEHCKINNTTKKFKCVFYYKSLRDSVSLFRVGIISPNKPIKINPYRYPYSFKFPMPSASSLYLEYQRPKGTEMNIFTSGTQCNLILPSKRLNSKSHFYLSFKHDDDEDDDDDDGSSLNSSSIKLRLENANIYTREHSTESFKSNSYVLISTWAGAETLLELNRVYRGNVAKNSYSYYQIMVKRSESAVIEVRTESDIQQAIRIFVSRGDQRHPTAQNCDFEVEANYAINEVILGPEQHKNAGFNPQYATYIIAISSDDEVEYSIVAFNERLRLIQVSTGETYKIKASVKSAAVFEIANHYDDTVNESIYYLWSSAPFTAYYIKVEDSFIDYGDAIERCDKKESLLTRDWIASKTFKGTIQLDKTCPLCRHLLVVYSSTKHLTDVHMAFVGKKDTPIRLTRGSQIREVLQKGETGWFTFHSNLNVPTISFKLHVYRGMINVDYFEGKEIKYIRVNDSVSHQERNIEKITILPFHSYNNTGTEFKWRLVALDPDTEYRMTLSMDNEFEEILPGEELYLTNPEVKKSFHFFRIDKDSPFKSLRLKLTVNSRNFDVHKGGTLSVSYASSLSSERTELSGLKLISSFNTYHYVTRYIDFPEKLKPGYYLLSFNHKDTVKYSFAKASFKIQLVADNILSMGFNEKEEFILDPGQKATIMLPIKSTGYVRFEASSCSKDMEFTVNPGDRSSDVGTTTFLFTSQSSHSFRVYISQPQTLFFEYENIGTRKANVYLLSEASVKEKGGDRSVKETLLDFIDPGRIEYAGYSSDGPGFLYFRHTGIKVKEGLNPPYYKDARSAIIFNRYTMYIGDIPDESLKICPASTLLSSSFYSTLSETFHTLQLSHPSSSSSFSLSLTSPSFLIPLGIYASSSSPLTLASLRGLSSAPAITFQWVASIEFYALEGAGYRIGGTTLRSESSVVNRPWDKEVDFFGKNGKHDYQARKTYSRFAFWAAILAAAAWAIDWANRRRKQIRLKEAKDDREKKFEMVSPENSAVLK